MIKEVATERLVTPGLHMTNPQRRLCNKAREVPAPGPPRVEREFSLKRTHRFRPVYSPAPRTSKTFTQQLEQKVSCANWTQLVRWERRQKAQQSQINKRIAYNVKQPRTPAQSFKLDTLQLALTAVTLFLGAVQAEMNQRKTQNRGA